MKPSQKFIPVDHVADARAKKKTRQAFYTPLSLVGHMVEELGLPTGSVVLEPSAGDGRIVHALIERGYRVHACEIEPEMARRCEGFGAEIVASDFLSFRPAEPYAGIVMNPPFTRGQDKKHIEHAYAMLAPGGQLLSVASWNMREEMMCGRVKLDGCEIATCEALSEETFAEQGTKVKTVLIQVARAHPNIKYEVEGFANHQTWNAALAVTSDSKLSKAARAIGTEEGMRQLAMPALVDSCSPLYGINWRDVIEYVRQLNDEMNPIPF